jgi:D-alanyl-D-alanine carboxypeptidase/D-alanyl-D-alanine-endopeptidase (penicillin-binding protein 4)
MVALSFYGAQAVHASHTMSVRIKAFAPVTLPAKNCVRHMHEAPCYDVALFVSPRWAARSEWLKTFRFILALVILLGPAASGARAQVVPNEVQPPVSVSPLPSVDGTNATADDVLPQTEEQPSFNHQGVLVEKLSGETVRDQAADQPFNPASAVKLATTFAALRIFGPKYRFATTVWINGTFDKTTGTVSGDLIVSGRDPSFHDEHAVAVARELNQLGIKTVTGDLIVAPRFSMNFSPSSQHSGERLYDTLDAERRPTAATRAWYESRMALHDTKALRTTPSVAVMGAVYVDAVPKGARAISTHYSPALVDVLKVLLCYSNNFMAERLGDQLGGAGGVMRVLSNDLGFKAGEFHLASTSGLGTNRMTPRQMLKLYRALLDELHKGDLKAADILPVAGVDPGTLQRRYAASPSRGSVIAKTGTLPRTDGGASALVGQLRTRDGNTLLFVILDQRGSITRFRQWQDALVAELQNARGGPLPFTYAPQTLAIRLSTSEFDSARSSTLDEYEPTTPNQ